MIAADTRPMSAAPLDGAPIRLFVSAGSAIASFWSEERCQKTFGAGCYRAGGICSTTIQSSLMTLWDGSHWSTLVLKMTLCACQKRDDGLQAYPLTGQAHEQVGELLRRLWRQARSCFPSSLGPSLLPQSLQGQLSCKVSEGPCAHEKVVRRSPSRSDPPRVLTNAAIGGPHSIPRGR